jgi:hypothetical protein
MTLIKLTSLEYYAFPKIDRKYITEKAFLKTAENMTVYPQDHQDYQEYLKDTEYGVEGIHFDLDSFSIYYYNSIVSVSTGYPWNRMFLIDDYFRYYYRKNIEKIAKVFKANIKFVYHSTDDIFYKLSEKITENSTFQDLVLELSSNYSSKELNPSLPFSQSLEELWGSFYYPDSPCPNLPTAHKKSHKYNLLIDYFNGI